MATLHRVPIRRKLRLVILATCTAALCVASTALFATQFYLFKRDYQRDIVAVGEIIAGMSTGAIAAGLPDSTGDILAALTTKSHIVGAFVRIKSDGRVYGRFGQLKEPLPGRGMADGFQDYGGEFIYVTPITQEGERLGSLVLVTDYNRALLHLHGVYASILIVVLATSFLVAALVSSRLEGLITDPILSLAKTARSIGSRSDYSLRAEVAADDELGAFTESFNHMLDQIQSRDSALLHEIAERARTEAELQRVHQQLMEASREAGMAEVATGVIHNVGNVLNSVNVSTTLLSESLAASRTENLVKAVALLGGANGSAGAFLENDPRGKLLPGYLMEVSAQIAGERQSAMKELELLTRNIGHIKQIVAMQQSYARLSGVLESVPARELIEDALRMSSGSFERHGIEIVRRFEDVPAVLVDKHNVLQVLVNLLRNAKYAIDEAAPLLKRVTVSVRTQSEMLVEIVIEDSGVGIPAENLTRIFSHGFTTRKNGHGFGLHSGALAAKEMGGMLTAQSAGPGCGATFIFSLPVSGALAT